MAANDRVTREALGLLPGESLSVQRHARELLIPQAGNFSTLIMIAGALDEGGAGRAAARAAAKAAAQAAEQAKKQQQDGRGSGGAASTRNPRSPVVLAVAARMRRSAERPDHTVAGPHWWKQVEEACAAACEPLPAWARAIARRAIGIRKGDLRGRRRGHDGARSRQWHRQGRAPSPPARTGGAFESSSGAARPSFCAGSRRVGRRSTCGAAGPC